MRFKPSPNWLLAFIPVTVALERSHASPVLVFFTAALAIVPAARLIVIATEQISTRTGDAVGGLLNATFGNLPELIIATVALQSGLLEMVRASIIGAILANLLMALGFAMLAGGLRNHDQTYNAGAARVYSSMMLLSVIALAAPAGFERTFSGAEHLPQVHRLNILLAVVLLAIYVLYLVFMLRTHKEAFAGAGHGEEGHAGHTQWSIPRAVGTLVGASALAAWMSEVLVGAAEGAGEMMGMSQTFIGMIVVAIVGGSAESLSAIAAGAKNKLDLSMGIVYGSCIQIALFVAPVLVLVSRFIAPEPLDLSFGRGELVVLFMAVIIGGSVANDGKGNWFKGVQLLAVYAMIALMLYFVPSL